MADTKDFMHLPLPLKEDGRAFYRRPSVPPQTQTAQNQQNRQLHGGNLKRSAANLSRFWKDRRAERIQQNLPTIDGGVPFLLQIDPTTDVDFLRGMGFEVVCDLDDGFIVVASDNTDLSVFVQKVDDFIRNKHRSGSPAKVYALCTDDDRLKRILSTSLYNGWATLNATTPYTVDISIECNGLNAPPHEPERYSNESDADYAARLAAAKNDFYQRIDDLASARQQQLTNFVDDYNGQLLSEFIEETDSFVVRISLTGAGLRDLVLNYPYIFDVTENPEVKMETAVENVQQLTDSLTISAPKAGSPIVCVIDSGIQENHRYLTPAIIQGDSLCLVPNQSSVNDDVSSGGHGTRVAGAILYYRNIPTDGDYVLPCFIRNIKALDHNNKMPIDINPSRIVQDVVKEFAINALVKTKIFNHSIGENKPFYEFKHMSAWAAQIDAVSYDNDVLFIQAAGNMTADVIRAHIQAGFAYPDYFGREQSRLSNPAQSLQAITVGSISHSDFEDDDRMAMGKSGEVSSFSRIGPGIWDTIKPDVVEYGGTHAINKKDKTLTTPAEVCTDLIRRSPQGPAHAKDDIGTSFAAPKVAHIVSEIQKTLQIFAPNAPALLCRALIAQSAKLPQDVSFLNSDQKQMLMRQMGYGLPDVTRATTNNDYRATLVSTEATEIGAGEAHIYPIRFPEELRSIGEDYNILVEITLSYSAKPRRTRRGVKNYMSTWLDWVCSRIGESEDTFRQRVFETDSSIQDDGAFKWAIREQNNWGDFKGFSRNRQTLQKDWCIVKSSQLSNAFCVAVRGHKGWGSLFKAKYALVVSFEAIDQNIEIYEHIRINNRVEIDNQEVRVEIENFTKEG